MKDTGSGFHGRHLKRSIDYILNGDKTEECKYAGAVNCRLDNAFEQMRATKILFNKTDKRQGYHFIISFPEKEATPESAFELAGKFVDEYLADKYEVVYSVHNNTEHIHAHIVFNSVSFLDGSKFRYEKGDWEKEIQPIVNRLCKEYGFSELDISDDAGIAEKQQRVWNDDKDGSFVWAEMIKRDIDSCILQGIDYEDFIRLMSDLGYEVKQGKHLAVKAPGMTKFRRTYRLGDNYSEERIRNRVERENLATYMKQQDSTLLKGYVKIKHYKKCKLSGIQKKYFAKLYRIGMLKKMPYSQAWKYKDDVKRFHMLQEQYLFLSEREIDEAEKLLSVADQISKEIKNINANRSKIMRAQAKMSEEFAIADKIEKLMPAKDSYMNGDYFFADEYKEFVQLEEQLRQRGYSFVEICRIRDEYKNELSEIYERIREQKHSLFIAEGLISELRDESARAREHVEEINEKRDIGAKSKESREEAKNKRR